MSYGATVKVVAAREGEAFPRAFFIWHEGTLTHPAGFIPCGLSPGGKGRTRVQILDSQIRCLAQLSSGAARYYEHFASNPAKCVAWLECKQ